MFDTSRLGGWADLPFWSGELPRIEAALAGQSVLPPKDRTFRALELCQPEATRVIILGQDPYHTPGKADGLAFSIPQDFGETGTRPDSPLSTAVQWYCDFCRVVLRDDEQRSQRVEGTAQWYCDFCRVVLA